MTVYIVTNRYAYILGVFDSLELAQEALEKNDDLKGFEIVDVELNKTY